MEPDAYIFSRNDGSGEPLWDSTVREALKAAAQAAGCDFLGFGMHSFRRANPDFSPHYGEKPLFMA